MNFFQLSLLINFFDEFISCSIFDFSGLIVVQILYILRTKIVSIIVCNILIVDFLHSLFICDNFFKLKLFINNFIEESFITIILPKNLFLNLILNMTSSIHRFIAASCHSTLIIVLASLGSSILSSSGLAWLVDWRLVLVGWYLSWIVLHSFEIFLVNK